MRDIHRDRVTILQESPVQPFRSSTMTIPVPSVVIYREYVRIPYDLAVAPARWSGSNILRRDRYICAYCGGHANSVDHVLPKSQGGVNSWENTVASCKPCNRKKADKTPEEAGMPLRFQPFQMTKRDMVEMAVMEAGIDLQSILVVE